MRRFIVFLFLGVRSLRLSNCNPTVANAEWLVKPKLTLDEFFNSVSFPSVKVSPDGNSVVIETEKADWNQQIFRKELWLYRVDQREICSS